MNSPAVFPRISKDPLVFQEVRATERRSEKQDCFHDAYYTTDYCLNGMLFTSLIVRFGLPPGEGICYNTPREEFIAQACIHLGIRVPGRVRGIGRRRALAV